MTLLKLGFDAATHLFERSAFSGGSGRAAPGAVPPVYAPGVD
jgi:hypothetical protein